MARSSFLLFKRPAKKVFAKKLYYVKIWQPNEQTYTIPKSLSVIAEELGINTQLWPPSTKAGAKHIAEEYLELRGPVSKKNNPLLWEYCFSFWDWNSEYVQGKLERGQLIGKQHCSDSQYRIKEHVKKRIPDLYLLDVTSKDLDKLQIRLKQETKLSGKTINSTMAAVITPIREAYRLNKLLKKDPSENFRHLPENSKKRGIFSAAEAKGLFSTHWETEQNRLCSLVSYCTGARLGEVLALTPDDIKTDFEGKPVLWIKKSFSRFSGIKSTKTGNEKVVPISERLKSDLLKLAEQNPHGNGFIFWGPESDKPISYRVIGRAFCYQLRKVGINEQIRKARNLSFHSLRHNLNSTLRGKMDDATLRLIMGHADPESTNTYDHLTDRRLSEMRASIEKNLFEDIGLEI